MYGIGTDIITISRIEKSLEKPSFLTKVYGEREIALFAGEKLKVNSLAANFAAKEAFGKALGTGVRGFELYEVEILRDELGKPYFHLSGRAKENRSRMGLPFVMFNVCDIATPKCIFFLHFIGVFAPCQGVKIP